MSLCVLLALPIVSLYNYVLLFCVDLLAFALSSPFVTMSGESCFCVFCYVLVPFICTATISLCCPPFLYVSLSLSVSCFPVTMSVDSSLCVF